MEVVVGNVAVATDVLTVSRLSSDYAVVPQPPRTNALTKTVAAVLPMGTSRVNTVNPS